VDGVGDRGVRRGDPGAAVGKPEMTDTQRQLITLIGGPLDGQQRQMHPNSNRYFEDWDVGPAENWPPPARRRDMATYRRVNETTFAYAETQTAMGDADRTFYRDPASNLHPYECNGPGKCMHCDRLVTYDHLPHECALCRADRKEQL
jgi:hypothetical protein